MTKKCAKLFAKLVAINPAENKEPPKKAIFRNPNFFNRTPFTNPSVIPNAEFKFNINEESVADMLIASNLSLNINPKLVNTGTIISCNDFYKIKIYVSVAFLK